LFVSVMPLPVATICAKAFAIGGHHLPQTLAAGCPNTGVSRFNAALNASL